MKTKTKAKILTGAAILGITGYASTFQIDQTEKAVLTEFGSPIGEFTEPGLYFKMPWQTANEFSSMNLIYVSPPSDIVTTDSQYLKLGSVGVWTVDSPLLFMQKAKNERAAQILVDDSIGTSKRQVIGKYSQKEAMVLESTDKINAEVFDIARERLKPYGINLIDIQIIPGGEGGGLPDQTLESVYGRMISERAQIAERYRAEGLRGKNNIISETDKNITIMIKTAEKRAQEIMGEADKQALDIYSNSLKSDPDLLRLVLGLDALKNIPDGSTIQIDPDSKIAKPLGIK